jgi:hypothetical protein
MLKSVLLTAALVFAAASGPQVSGPTINWSIIPEGRSDGVTPDYVRSLQRAGMAHLSADQLVRLRISGFSGRTN